MNATDAMGIFCSLPLEYVCFSRNHFGILSDCTVKASLPERVNAVICDVDVSWTDDDFTDFFIINYKYHPVYQYTLDGQEYRVVSRVEYSKRTKSKSVVMRCSLWMKRIPVLFLPL